MRVGDWAQLPRAARVADSLPPAALDRVTVQVAGRDTTATVSVARFYRGAFLHWIQMSNRFNGCAHHARWHVLVVWLVLFFFFSSSRH